MVEEGRIELPELLLLPEPSSVCPCTLDFIGICFQKKAAPTLHYPPPLSLSPSLFQYLVH